ncbi:MAG: NDP-sugar synthase, partial [Chloroflexota bacterium]|nr:NDP-sugar synthase [Chloroflexota bacterium]
MKAVILVGGQGTRLRPLTTNTPKPLIPLVNRPFLDHVLYLLRRHDIEDVVLAVAFLPESFEQTYGDGSAQGVKLTYVHEAEPLDTGGAIKNVERYLDPGETFLVFNGDILTDLDLTDMLRFHKEHGSVCTISLTPVEDPSSYGAVDVDESGRIRRFTEKPKREEATSNWINAGTYILQPEVLANVPPGQRYSVERGLFPALLSHGRPLYGYRTGAYWIDVGTPSKYLQAHADLLAGRLKFSLQPEGENPWENVWTGEGTVIESGALVAGPVVLGKGCNVRTGASITGPAALGDGCQVGQEAQLENLVAWNNVMFGERSHSRECVLANGASVGA